MGNKRVTIGCILFFLLATGYIHAMRPTINNEADPPPHEELDKAFLRIIYMASQQATDEKEKIMITDTMALDIAPNWSVYYDWKKERRDSIAKEAGQKLFSTIKSVNVLKNAGAEMFASFDNRNLKAEILDGRKGESARIYKNRPGNEIVTIDNGPASGAGNSIQLRLKEKILPMDWQISEDTLSVMGYLCYRATAPFRGRNYNVWFSPEVPVNEGPWKLYGLPGTILSAETEDGLFRFQAIGIERAKDIPILFPANRHFEEAKNQKQMNDYKKSKLKEISVSYMDNGAMTILTKRNPVEYNYQELSE